MPGRSHLGVTVAGLVAAVVVAPAQAAPPVNDAPQSAAIFQPYTAQYGVPTQQEALTGFAEALPDAGVPACLGSGSFARTVWYRVPEAQTPTEVTVEAVGNTLELVDLAAFVQGEVLPPAAPAPAPAKKRKSARTKARIAQVGGVFTSEPNQCAGLGAGGSDAAEEPTSAITLRLPARRPMLIQAGRRGPFTNVYEDNALVTLEVTALEDIGTPEGDVAKPSTPLAKGTGTNRIELAGASITEEDPAQPPCPSLGTVWRRVLPGATGKRLITVTGGKASTLTVFSGSRPTGDNVLDCVNRESAGSLQMVVPVKRKKPVWVRIGADATTGFEQARLKVTEVTDKVVVDGGPGGFDPTPGGPAGGLPELCDRADVTKAVFSGSTFRGSARAYNRFTRVPVTLRMRGSSVCDAELRLYGPGGGIYAKGLAIRVKPGTQTVRLPRQRSFRRGSYRLQIKGVTQRSKRVVVKGSVRGSLRK